MKKYHWKYTIASFFTAQTVSLFGSSLVQYAIIWHITLSVSSGKALTIATICGFLPQVLISLFAGVWVDRYDRKKLILISDSVIACATLILALAFMKGYDYIGLLYIVLAIRSAGTGIQTPAVQSVIPQIVPDKYLLKVNGIYSSITSLILFLSPAVSGMILSFTSLEAALFIDVGTAVAGVGITSVLSISRQLPNHKKDLSNLAEIREGMNYLRQNKWIRNLLLYQAAVMFLISPSAFLTPLLVSRTFGTEIWRLTASEMTYSLGMVAGGILIAWWGGFEKKLYTTLLAGAVYGGLMIGIGMSPAFIMYLVCNMLIGITAPCYNAPLTATIQEKADAAMHGRIFSLMQFVSSSIFPMGMVVFGPLADYIHVGGVLIISGIIVLALSLYVWSKKCLN